MQVFLLLAAREGTSIRKGHWIVKSIQEAYTFPLFSTL